MKTVGYLRVSTEKQETEKNKADILLFANNKMFGHVDFVEEVVTGKKNWKERAIKGVVDNLKKGDNLVVPELSRLGRNMLEIMEILSILKDKEVNVFALKGDWALNGSIQSKIIAMVFAMAAEIERELISQRTIEGLKAAKARGVKLGRKPGPGKSKLDPHREEIEALLKNGSRIIFIARKYGMTDDGVSKWIRKNKIEAWR